jgi:hypothetical protein
MATQHKLTTQWREGTVSVEHSKICIRQGTNVIYITVDQRDEFLTDIEAATLPKPIPGVGYDGGMFPLAPNPKPNTPKPKSMQDIIQNMEFIAHGWRTIT